MRLKSRIGDCINDRGYKNKYVAEKIGVTQNTLSRWINNGSMPSVNKVFELAAVLNCKVDDLYTWENEDK